MATYTGDKAFDRTLTATLTVTSLMLAASRFTFSRAPYGKYGGGKSNGVSLDPRLGWWLMELPATLSFVYNFTRGRARKVEAEKHERDIEKKKKGPSGLTPKFLCFLWLLHYGNRGWYFPLTIRVAEGGKESFALFNAAIGAVFLTAHGYLNGRLFSELGEKYDANWMKDPRFIVGLIIHQIGYWMVVHSEKIMRDLRPVGVVVSAADRYKIPYGGMYKYVTNPAYLGEILSWLGWTVLTWSPTTLPALFITLSNLVPRALEQQKWYLKKFPDYPKDRTALIPFLL